MKLRSKLLALSLLTLLLPWSAWKLLQEAASPRTPFTIVLAEWLADRIGNGAALRHMHRERVVPLAELDASAALRAELERIRSTRR